MGCCCGKETKVHEEHAGDANPKTTAAEDVGVPPETVQGKDWPDLRRRNEISRTHFNQYKLKVIETPLNKLTRRQWPLPMGVLSMHDRTFTVDARFQDIESFEDVDWEVLKSQAPNEALLIDLSLNRIRSIHQTSLSINLTSLNISGNYLEDISGLSACANLLVLNACDNRIAKVDSVLQGCTRLIMLKLSRNNLRSLPFGGSGICSSLQTLEVSENRDISLHGLIKLLVLQRLECNNCKLTSIADVSGLSKLEELHVADNYINDLDETLVSISDLKSLKNLVLTGNPICEDKFYFMKVLEATLSNRLLSLDLRALDGNDYQIISEATEMPSRADPTLLTEKAKHMYSQRRDALQKSSAGATTRHLNDPVMEDILREATEELNKRMTVVVEYVSEITS